MTRKEFFDAAQRFDWYYMMSDDHRTWKAGRYRRDELQAEARQDPVKQQILEAWDQHMYSGPNWGTERTPRPQLEDFIDPEDSGI